MLNCSSNRFSRSTGFTKMSSGSGKGGLRLCARNEVKLNLHCLIGYWCVAVFAVLTQLDINQALICPCLHTEGEHETLRFKTVFIYFQVIKQKTTEGHNPKDSNNAKKEKQHIYFPLFLMSRSITNSKNVFFMAVFSIKEFSSLGNNLPTRTHTPTRHSLK